MMQDPPGSGQLDAMLDPLSQLHDLLLRKKLDQMTRNANRLHSHLRRVGSFHADTTASIPLRRSSSQPSTAAAAGAESQPTAVISSVEVGTPSLLPIAESTVIVNDSKS